MPLLLDCMFVSVRCAVCLSVYLSVAAPLSALPWTSLPPPFWAVEFITLTLDVLDPTYMGNAEDNVNPNGSMHPHPPYRWKDKNCGFPFDMRQEAEGKCTLSIVNSWLIYSVQNDLQQIFMFRRHLIIRLLVALFLVYFFQFLRD